MRSMPGGKMRATWSPVLILARSNKREPTRSARLCSCEHVRSCATPPFEFSRVKITCSDVLTARHRRISEINWYWNKNYSLTTSIAFNYIFKDWIINAVLEKLRLKQVLYAINVLTKGFTNSWAHVYKSKVERNLTKLI